MIAPAAHLRALIDISPAVLGAIIVGALFALLDLPAPWLSGGMLGAVMSGFARPLAETPGWMRDSGFLIAGAAMGASVTPETLTLIGKMPASFVMLALGILVIMTLSARWLMLVHGWKREDALLASAPGALSTVLAISAERKGDVAGVAIVQTLRIFIIIALLPGVIGWIEGVHASRALAPQGYMNLWTLCLMLAGGYLCSLVLALTRMANPRMLGAALFGATLHGAGYVEGQVPVPVAIVGFLFVGVMIATRTRNVTWSGVVRYGAASLSSFTITASVAALFAVATSALLNISLGATLLAFAPGGIEAMTLLSISLAFDALYVAAHHIARFMGCAFGLPLYFRVTDHGKSPS